MTMTDTSRLIMRLFFLCLCASDCSGCQSSVMAVDSSVRDIRDELRADTVVRDTRIPDVPDVPPDGPWIPLTFAPQCGIQVARDPSTVVPPLLWIPCQDGRPSCLQLSPNWEGQPPYQFDLGGIDVAGRMMAVVTHYDVRRGRDRIVLTPIDGTPFMVFDNIPNNASRSNCWGVAFPNAMRAPGDGFVLDITVGNTAGTTIETYFLTGPMAYDNRWFTPTAHLPPLPTFHFNPMVLQGEIITGVGGTILRSNSQTHEFETVASPSTVNGYPLCCAQPYNNSMFFGVEDATNSAWVVTEGSAPVRLMDFPSGVTPSPFLPSDNQLYWYTMQDPIPRTGGWSRIELWTSPLSLQRSGFSPRRIARVNATAIRQSLVRGNFLVYMVNSVADGYVVYLVDVRDGSYSVFRPPPELLVRSLAFLNLEEVGVVLQYRDETLGATVYRIRLDSFGPLLPPPL